MIVFYLNVRNVFLREAEKRTVKDDVNFITFIYKSRSKYFTNWG